MNTMLAFWLDEPIYLAGDVVPPGAYHEIGTGRTVTVQQGDRLPSEAGGSLRVYVIVRTEADTGDSATPAHLRTADSQHRSRRELRDDDSDAS